MNYQISVNVNICVVTSDNYEISSYMRRETMIIRRPFIIYLNQSGNKKYKTFNLDLIHISSQST